MWDIRVSFETAFGEPVIGPATDVTRASAGCQHLQGGVFSHPPARNVVSGDTPDPGGGFAPAPPDRIGDGRSPRARIDFSDGTPDPDEGCVTPTSPARPSVMSHPPARRVVSGDTSEPGGAPPPAPPDRLTVLSHPPARKVLSGDTPGPGGGCALCTPGSLEDCRVSSALGWLPLHKSQAQVGLLPLPPRAPDRLVPPARKVVSGDTPDPGGGFAPCTPRSHRRWTQPARSNRFLGRYPRS